LVLVKKVRKEKRERILGFIILIAVAMLSGCSRTPSERRPVEQGRVVKDSLGREVHLPEHITRSVSLAPSLTEMIFAIGAGDRLVGVTTYCNYPPETAAIAKVGDTQTANIETIIALKPDVVFVSTASQLEAFMKTLDNQGIAVYVTDPKDLEGVFTDLATLSELFETEQRAMTLIASLIERTEGVKEETAGKPPVRVFLQISRDPLYTIGEDSFLTGLIETAGGISVTKDVATAYPTLSKETALALKPDVIILSDSEDNREPNDVFKNSPAVKNGRIIRVNADIISRPGPRLVDALEQLAEQLNAGESISSPRRGDAETKPANEPQRR
jgi:ABC-type Fe3+-hydroxamate transport system substrate-binding protein